jgi:hypothetical protein
VTVRREKTEYLGKTTENTNSSRKIVGDARDQHHKDNWSSRRICRELIIYRKTTS